MRRFEVLDGPAGEPMEIDESNVIEGEKKKKKRNRKRKAGAEEI
jgi:hypothetical protein